LIAPAYPPRRIPRLEPGIRPPGSFMQIYATGNLTVFYAGARPDSSSYCNIVSH
jgi:hypothetical protein